MTEFKLSESIYAIMKKKKMKQSLVAEAGGYTPREFNALLRDRKRYGEGDIPRICSALECSPNELFGYNETQKGA